MTSDEYQGELLVDISKMLYAMHKSAAFDLTLRDWFAGLALLSIGNQVTKQDTARSAYALANAMLKAREEKK